MNVHRKQLAEAPRAGEALAQTKYMPSDVVHRAAFRQMLLDIRAHVAQSLRPADHWRIAAEQLLIDACQQIGVVVGLATQHDAIEGLQVRAAVADFLQQERSGVLAYAEAARQALPYRQAGD